MPHLTLEYTDNLPQLNPRETLLALNNILIASNQFNEADIKSRAILLDTYVIGHSPENRAFVYAKLAILSGRSTEIKQLLSTQLLEALKQLCPCPPTMALQLCVDIIDTNRDTYSKMSLS